VMSAFTVNSSAIREFADSTLDVAYDDTSDAKTYVETYGNFSFHQTGAIGWIAGTHHDLMSRLESMLGHIQNVVERSKEALLQTAAAYDHTDLRAAAAVDATYPQVPRPAVTRN
jgi:aspartate aminotransferase-like enzyme